MVASEERRAQELNDEAVRRAAMPVSCAPLWANIHVFNKIYLITESLHFEIAEFSMLYLPT